MAASAQLQHVQPDSQDGSNEQHRESADLVDHDEQNNTEGADEQHNETIVRRG